MYLNGTALARLLNDVHCLLEGGGGGARRGGRQLGVFPATKKSIISDTEALRIAN